MSVLLSSDLDSSADDHKDTWNFNVSLKLLEKPAIKRVFFVISGFDFFIIHKCFHHTECYFNTNQ